MSTNPIDVQRSRPPKCRSLSVRARCIRRSSDGRRRSIRCSIRLRIVSAHCCRSAFGIHDGTRSSSTPALRRAVTVRRRRLEGTMRTGGVNWFESRSKTLCSVCCWDDCSDCRQPRGEVKPSLLSWPRKSVPRSLVIGNGNVLVGFDANYSVRDVYFPRVGDAHQPMGNVCRSGFFIDGKFAWVEDPGWERHLGYAEDSLVTMVTLTNARLGI